MTNEFLPDWVSPPGSTIQDFLEMNNISFKIFCQLMKVEPEIGKGLLDGTVGITQEIANRLEKHLCATSKFWMTREAHYRAGLIRLTDKYMGIQESTHVRMIDEVEIVKTWTVYMVQDNHLMIHQTVKDREKHHIYLQREEAESILPALQKYVDSFKDGTP